MKVTLINRSDATGGAAVVSLRLVNALREVNIDARLLVVEKLTDSPYVEVAAPHSKAMRPFLKERLGIFTHNGFSRRNLFKVDTASSGLPLWKHPLVKDADIVVLGWVNQGMLSLSGIEKIHSMGKPLAWIMHDMWCLTGICHHAGDCRGYAEDCGFCPLLGIMSGKHDLSRRVWERKKKLYWKVPVTFLPVSHWLESKCRRSGLLADADVKVVPNPFPLPPRPVMRRDSGDNIRILFGAARLDDPVKGLPYMIETTRILAERNPALASRLEIVTFGNIRDASMLAEIRIPHRHAGLISDPGRLRSLYEDADIILSTSLFETLPGTLVEGQAYGCIPVSFHRGGQSDIVEHRYTGYLARYSDNVTEGASAIADGIEWAAGSLGDDMNYRMFRSVHRKFEATNVALRYADIFRRMIASRKHK